MSSSITITPKRIREIIAEEIAKRRLLYEKVTKGNLTDALIDILDVDLGDRLEISTQDDPASENPVWTFAISGYGNREKADAVANKIENSLQAVEDPRVGNFGQLQDPKRQARAIQVGDSWTVTGDVLDLWPESAGPISKPAGPTWWNLDPEDKNPADPRIEQMQTLKATQQTRRAAKPAADVVKALTATVMLEPVQTAMRIHADASPDVWWEEVKKELVAQSKAQLPPETVVAVGPWFRGTAKKIAQDVIASAPDSITQALDVAELEQDLVDAAEDPDTGLFGFDVDDTALSPKSESVDRLRRLIGQIIITSHLSNQA